MTGYTGLTRYNIEMKFEKLTEKIIGCAYHVYNEMGFGYLESIYEKCLLIEFRKSDISAESQVPIKVKYEGETVGNFVADILVENSIIIELKSVRQIAKAHEIQLVNYLISTQKDVAF